MKKNKRSIIIGLTGPIASGKSTIANYLAKHKAYVIDADLIGHKAIAPQSDIWHKIIKEFTGHVLNKGGVINRRKLGEIVFSDKRALKKLNIIIHPYILKVVRSLIDNAIKLKKKLIVVDAAVLKQIGLISYVNYVLVILSSKEKRLRRLISSGVSKKDALNRINSQESDAKYKKSADFVVMNNGTKAQLLKSVKEILSKIG